MLQVLIPAIAGLIGKAIDRAVPDAAEAEKLKAQIVGQAMTLAQQEMAGAVAIIEAEAKGESWLQRNWRPLLMITFAGLIVTRWLGLSAPGIDPALEMKLFDIVQLGLGGYVIGRSAEKVADAWSRKS